MGRKLKLPHKWKSQTIVASMFVAKFYATTRYNKMFKTIRPWGVSAAHMTLLLFENISFPTKFKQTSIKWIFKYNLGEYLKVYLESNQPKSISIRIDESSKKIIYTKIIIKQDLKRTKKLCHSY